MQNFVIVFHTVCAHVRGPKNFADYGSPPLGMRTWLTPRNMLLTPALPCQIQSFYVKLLECNYGDPPENIDRRRKRGVCRGSDTPTTYVGDIDMYISP